MFTTPFKDVVFYLFASGMNVRVHTGKAWPINLTDNEFVEIFNKPGDSESDIFSDNKIDNIAMKDAIINASDEKKKFAKCLFGKV